MTLKDRVVVVTGGAGGIGRAACLKLAGHQVRAIGVVDQADSTDAACADANRRSGRAVMIPYLGDVTDGAFREQVFSDLEDRFGVVSVCVPAAAIVRDRLCVKVTTRRGASDVDIYGEDDFQRVMEVNLIAPTYWAMRMVASVAKDRAGRGLGAWGPDESAQGAVVLIGSVSAAGNRGQISYATAKAGLEGACATLAKEAIYYGVRCTMIHPGFVDTPMARLPGEELLKKLVDENTQLRRLIRPEEVAEAICFMLTNPAVSGTLRVDAGWHPPPC